MKSYKLLHVCWAKIFHKPTLQHQTVTLLLSASPFHIILLPCFISYYLLPLPLPSFPHPCWHSALKVAADECSFEASRAVGTSRRVLYMCDFLVKLQISSLSKNRHRHRLYPLPSDDLQESLFIYFLPSISSLAPQSCSTASVPVIINNLEEMYYRTRAGVKREKYKNRKGEEEDERGHVSLLQQLRCLLLFNLSIVCVPPLIRLAISQSWGGFSMWLAIFSCHQVLPLKGSGKPVKMRIWAERHEVSDSEMCKMVSSLAACFLISYKNFRTCISSWLRIKHLGVTELDYINSQYTKVCFQFIKLVKKIY